MAGRASARPPTPPAHGDVRIACAARTHAGGVRRRAAEPDGEGSGVHRGRADRGPFLGRPRVGEAAGRSEARPLSAAPGRRARPAESAPRARPAGPEVAGAGAPGRGAGSDSRGQARARGRGEGRAQAGREARAEAPPRPVEPSRRRPEKEEALSFEDAMAALEDELGTDETRDLLKPQGSGAEPSDSESTAIARPWSDREPRAAGLGSRGVSHDPRALSESRAISRPRPRRAHRGRRVGDRTACRGASPARELRRSGFRPNSHRRGGTGGTVAAPPCTRRATAQSDV